MKTGIELIAEERARQISKEGWTPEHDDRHRRCELAMAGACYAAAVPILTNYHRSFPANELEPPQFPTLNWPWSSTWWKPSENQIKNLVRAGALIAAEIDRQQRLASKKQ